MRTMKEGHQETISAEQFEKEVLKDLSKEQEENMCVSCGA